MNGETLTGPARTRHGWTLLTAGAVACFALLLYLPTLRFPLLWDDPMLLELTSSRLKSGGLPALLSSEFILGSRGIHTGYYRPFILLSLAGEAWLGGGRPELFHLVNALIHAGVCGLTFLLLRRILHDGASALFGSLLFAAHPVHVEAVAFIAGRTDLWAALFVFLATIVWMEGRREGTVRPPRLAAALSVCLVAGLLSKEVAAMAIPAWLAWDLAGVARGGSVEPWWRRNRWWLSGGLLALGVAVALRLGLAGVPLGLPASPVAASGAVEPSALALFLPRLALNLKLLVAPWPLSAYYTPADLKFHPSLWLGAAAACALFLLAGITGKRSEGWAGPCWTFLFLLPVLGIFNLNASVVAERFVYISSFGACLAAAALWGRMHRRARWAGLATAGALLALFSVATLVRSQDWSSGLSLFTAMARDDPNVFVAHFNLGNELTKAGRLEEAEASLARALKISPARSDAWNNLGTVRVLRDRLKEAEAAYTEAVRLAPAFALAIENLATTLVKLQRPAEALAALEKIRSPGASELPILIEAGRGLSAGGQRDAAERAFARAVRAAPDQAKPLRYLASFYMEQARTPEALPLLERAVTLDSRDAPSRFTLGLARLLSGDTAGAARERDALRLLDPRLATDLEARLRSAGWRD